MKSPGTRTIRPLGNDDLPLLMQFLQSHREASLILLSNARRAGLEDQGKAFQGTYVASLCDGEITGVAAHYWNGMLTLQAPDDALALARHVRASSERSLNGLLGPSDQVRAAAAVSSDVPPVFDSEERLYSLDLADLILPTASGGVDGVRRATLEDLDTLARWSVDYNIELLGATERTSMLETSRKSVRRLIEGGHQWVLTGNGKERGKRDLLAACTFNAGIDDTIQIGGVWTPQALRRRGHARTVVAGALSTARHEGMNQAILFTGNRNRAARKAYEVLGFVPIGTYHIMLYRFPA